MRLATAQQVLTLMSVQNSTGTEAAANLALDLSYPIVESLLDTRLLLTDYVDYFNYGTLRSAYVNPYPATLSLASRFVAASPAIVVRESIDDQPLRTASDGVVVDPADYFVNESTGELVLLRAHRRGLSTVSVAYRAGFSDNGSQINDPALPAWLVTGAVTAAVHVLNTHPSTPANRKTPYAEEMSRMLRGYLYSTFAPHFRSRVDRLFSSRSVATDVV